VSAAGGQFDLDIMVVGAHPDDAEVFAGGSIALSVRQGLRVGIASLTRGEMGTRGTPEIRALEWAASMAIMQPAKHAVLELPDGALVDIPEHRLALARLIRQWRPRLLVSHAAGDRHPDHNAAHALARSSAFVAYMGRAPLQEERHQIAGLRFFLGHHDPAPPTPSFVVDITETFEIKREAVRCYRTQFHGGEGAHGNDPPTFISSPEYWEWFELRARHYGRLIGARYGEAYVMDGPAPAKMLA
jgi:bacillithiol biosynthesis deacetylase BshB1